MKRRLLAALMCLMVSGLAVGTVSAAPAPSYSAVLTADAGCAFTLKSSWKNTSVDTVYGIWYLEDVYRFTTQAPGIGPNGGTLRGRTATNQAGPMTVDSVNHPWRVLVQFYRGGAHQFELNATLDAPCTL